MVDPAERALVFSIGLNGYRWAWRKCIGSHRRYAARFRFDYACVDLPWTVPAADAAWLKIALIVRALEDLSHDWTLFVDADAQVQSRCPDFRSVAMPAHDVYMAHGHSGRLNSGVIVIRRSDGSHRFFRGIVTDCDGTVPAADVAPYENGHVIKHGKADPIVGRLERRWNNTADPDLDDYIRHFTGPMAARGRVHRTTTARWRSLASLRNRLAAVWAPARPDGPLRERLDRMVEAVAARYAVFGGSAAGGNERRRRGPAA